MTAKTICINALRVKQRADVPVFVFGVEGRMLLQIASVDPAKRTKEGTLTGYQRGAVQKHIQEILEYLQEPNSLLPNAIVIAFDSRVTFQVLQGAQRAEWGTFGQITIPLAANASQPKAGWIVDGQQRAMALGRLDPKRSFPVVVVGFQSDSPTVQREQFVLVNRTKPLPRDLLSEILPAVKTRLPRNLEKQQLAARVVETLRFDTQSPFFNRIRGLGASGEGANISQAALAAVVQNSIRKKGVLFNYFSGNGKRHDVPSMARAVNVFYEGVARTWPDAWQGAPGVSRLTHGVGMVAIGHLMDRVLPGIDITSNKAAASVEHRLAKIRNRCAWTRGRWPVLACAWNELQNTSQDKARLTEYLLKEYAAKS
jgi:DGQHR domain-containing protein